MSIQPTGSPCGCDSKGHSRYSRAANILKETKKHPDCKPLSNVVINMCPQLITRAYARARRVLDMSLLCVSGCVWVSVCVCCPGLSVSLCQAVCLSDRYTRWMDDATHRWTYGDWWHDRPPCFHKVKHSPLPPMDPRHASAQQGSCHFSTPCKTRCTLMQQSCQQMPSLETVAVT